ncbi:hypothetical protein BTUL_0197g00040 [Botrytis tulipae]|uniref:Uncharacterized protein n=1 Tax=Botrytis tulipae TaxID=87230 RepID=A0A4Z1EH43_9HELO|nr:hypothetical protein BTUL_0197g00040 [Botrytis tulipae]
MTVPPACFTSWHDTVSALDASMPKCNCLHENSERYFEEVQICRIIGRQTTITFLAFLSYQFAGTAGYSFYGLFLGLQYLSDSGSRVMFSERHQRLSAAGYNPGTAVNLWQEINGISKPTSVIHPSRRIYQTVGTAV